MSIENAPTYQDILRNCSLNDQPSKSLRGYIDGTISGYNEMPDNPTPEEVIAFREHPAYSARKKQVTINMLGLAGGRPYVNARLSRFAGENEIDWIGGKRPDGSSATGRLQQTHSFPYLNRISTKINQYVFQEQPEREGGNADVIKDITRNGQSVNDLMREVSALIFATKWCWIGVDAPARKEDGAQYSQAEKDALKIRPYWQLYSPLDVMDWKFDERGELLWLKSKRVKYDDADPFSVPTPNTVISLWEKGKVTEYTVIEKSDRRYSSGRRIKLEAEEIPLTNSMGAPLSVVPFVLCGDADAAPQPFDDLESINRSIMDLGSVDRANFFNASYPQLVLPASVMARSIQDGYAKSVTEVARLLIGFKYPITVEKDDQTPSYLMPDASAMAGLSDRIDRLKADLFEVVGLALEKNSRQVASAESKAWDNLDVSAVMTARAEQLEDIERKVLDVCLAWEAGFDVWEPKYNTNFDVGDFEAEIAALVAAGNMSLPAKVAQYITRKIVERVDRIGSRSDPEMLKELEDEISNWNPNEFINTLAMPEP